MRSAGILNFVLVSLPTYLTAVEVMALLPRSSLASSLSPPSSPPCSRACVSGGWTRRSAASITSWDSPAVRSASSMTRSTRAAATTADTWASESAWPLSSRTSSSSTASRLGRGGDLALLHASSPVVGAPVRPRVAPLSSRARARLSGVRSRGGTCGGRGRSSGLPLSSPSSPRPSLAAAPGGRGGDSGAAGDVRGELLRARSRALSTRWRWSA
mmetsp:Transcript_17402/g.54098  ORF Transcript_17402/g.54098 Transcript_17402/m.54098 type:complete len:214 (-) Transcript_17402:19-660(-)